MVARECSLTMWLQHSRIYLESTVNRMPFQMHVQSIGSGPWKRDEMGKFVITIRHIIMYSGPPEVES